MKAVRILLLLSSAIFTFNFANYMTLIIINHLTQDISALFGAVFFLLLMFFSYFIYRKFRKGSEILAGQLCFVLSILIVGSNDILNVLCILNATLGTIILLRDIKQKKIHKRNNI